MLTVIVVCVLMKHAHTIAPQYERSKKNDIKACKDTTRPQCAAYATPQPEGKDALTECAAYGAHATTQPAGKDALTECAAYGVHATSVDDTYEVVSNDVKPSNDVNKEELEYERIR